MANFYIGLGVKSDLKQNSGNAMIKIADNETREIKISTEEIKTQDKESLILLLMSKVEENLRKVL